MNIYTILLFDGYNSREIKVESMDVVQAVQNNGIMPQQVIRIELVGSSAREDYTPQ